MSFRHSDILDDARRRRCRVNQDKNHYIIDCDNFQIAYDKERSKIKDTLIGVIVDAELIEPMGDGTFTMTPSHDYVAEKMNLLGCQIKAVDAQQRPGLMVFDCSRETSVTGLAIMFNFMLEMIPELKAISRTEPSTGFKSDMWRSWN